MRVTVRLFARLRELAGCESWTCDVPASASIQDVWRALANRFPDVAPFGRSISCARNQDFARMTTAVSDGDEIAFLPPVSGGGR